MNKNKISKIDLITKKGLDKLKRLNKLKKTKKRKINIYLTEAKSHLPKNFQ